MTAVLIIEGLVILLLLVLVAGLLNSHAEILRQLHRIQDPHGLRDVPANTTLDMAPVGQIDGIDPNGAPRVVDLSNGRANTVLAFLSSGCASCQSFWQQLSWDHDLSMHNTRLVVVTKGPTSESPARIAEIAHPDVTVIMSDDAWNVFRVPMTPFFVMIDPTRRIMGEGSAASWKQLLRLLQRARADTQHPAGLDTREREQFTDERLGRSGIAPDDPSLHEHPLES